MTKNNLKIVKSGKNQDTEVKEKNKALDAAISQIDENFGKGSVMKLGQKAAMNIEANINRFFKLRFSSWNRRSSQRKNCRNLWSRIFWKDYFSTTSGC